MTAAIVLLFAAVLIVIAALKIRRWQLARAQVRTAHRMAYGFIGRPARTRVLDRMVAEFRRWVADRIRYAVAFTAMVAPLLILILTVAQFGGKT